MSLPPRLLHVAARRIDPASYASGYRNLSGSLHLCHVSFHAKLRGKTGFVKEIPREAPKPRPYQAPPPKPRIVVDLRKSRLEQLIRGYDDKGAPVYALRPSDTQVITLRDGRNLCYAVYGRLVAGGEDIVCFHGTPGSRLSGAKLHDWALYENVRLICFDRPGYGHSTFKEGLDYHEIARDTQELLRHLDSRQCRVIGISGGSAPALACASYFSKARLLATGIMSGCAPIEAPRRGVPLDNQLFSFLCQINPKLTRLFSSSRRGAEAMVSNRLQTVEGLRRGSYKADNLVALDTLEESRQGVQAFLEDKRRRDNYWGFDVLKIDSNPIVWYHGERDVNTPVSSAKWLNKYLDQMVLKVKTGLDHRTVQEKYFVEFLRDVRARG